MTATRTRAAPHRPPAAVTCRRKALCGTAAVGAPRFGCSSVLREHLRTIRSACLVNSSENTHNTAPSSCSRARVSRRLLCSPRDGLCSITHIGLHAADGGLRLRAQGPVRQGARLPAPPPDGRAGPAADGVLAAGAAWRGRVRLRRRRLDERGALRHAVRRCTHACGPLSRLYGSDSCVVTDDSKKYETPLTWLPSQREAGLHTLLPRPR